MLVSKGAVVYVVTKMVGLGVVALAVINNSSLSPDLRAIVVALLSGLLGILGIVIGGHINAKSNRDVLEKAAENHQLAQQNRQLLEEIRELTGKTQDVIERRNEPR